MSGFVSSAVQLLGRLLLSAIFIQFGLAKAGDMAGTVGSITHLGLPMPGIAYYVTLAVEIGGGFLILAGLFTRPAALVLAVWCLATGLAAHYQPGDVNNMTHFMKNVAMAGGFLQLVALGAGGLSFDTLVRRTA